MHPLTDPAAVPATPHTPPQSSAAGASPLLLPLLFALPLIAVSYALQTATLQHQALNAACALAAVASFWCIWHGAESRLSAWGSWLGACLLGAAWLSFMAMPSASTLLLSAGLLGGLLDASDRPATSATRAVMLALAMAAGGLLSARQTDIAAAAAIPIALASTAVSYYRAQERTARAGRPIVLASALALLSQMAAALPAASSGRVHAQGAGLVGQVCALLALCLVYRAVSDRARALRLPGTPAMAHRITDERMARSDDEHRLLVDYAPDAIIVTDARGRIERSNPRVQELLGYAPEELVGQSLECLMPPDIAAHHGLRMQAHGSTPRGMTAEGREVLAVRKDGSTVWVHVRVGEMPDRGGRRFVGYLRDMSVHKRAQEALRHSEDKLRKLYDLSPLGIALTDMQGRFLDFNGAFVVLTGYDGPALRGLSYWDLTPSEYAAGEQRNLDSLQRIGRYGPYEKSYRCRSGELRPVRLNGVRIELDGEPCIWSIVEDLTERRAAEQEHDRLQRQLMQSQKMEALGQLTGGIAHDFNNMLAGILGLSSLALERHVNDPSSKLATYLREITRVSERGRDLVDRLMRFSRPVAPQPPQSRALQPVVEEVLRMLESALPAQLTIKLQSAPALAHASFVEIDLHQVLTNLIINARDALGGSGEIVIGLAPLPAAGCECSSCGRHVGGEHVVLSVSDNGTGIPAALIPRIFDPFFTTKDVGKGTGLGLAMVHSLVHQSGGHIVVSSTDGHGTRFEVLLPVTATVAPGAEAHAAGGGLANPAQPSH